ncbi:RecX family transcriptional regulator [Candidatus Saccharibacteria bacterium]|nr:MAG: RecX family transcriptional regulator [Candidatus Saccharibacteria bacterium]
MKITSISAQVRNPDRVNISIDGMYRLSLDILQVTDLGVRVGRELGEQELAELETESQFGKLYTRALEYCLMRPHSVREVRDYLYKKTLAKKYKDRQGQLHEKNGYLPALTERVLTTLQQKKYVDDEQFARWWVENRNLTKGTSLRKLTAELRAKGVSGEIIDQVMRQSDRDDKSELAKIIAKKRSKYPDDQKMLQYLARQGFSYDQAKEALAE